MPKHRALDLRGCPAAASVPRRSPVSFFVPCDDISLVVMRTTPAAVSALRRCWLSLLAFRSCRSVCLVPWMVTRITPAAASALRRSPFLLLATSLLVMALGPCTHDVMFVYHGLLCCTVVICFTMLHRFLCEPHKAALTRETHSTV
ncbi:hypothetical protein IW262DRAFT_218965 [Armillaria fumosa]|nr:hypothetical protein IW262DRAFT_218965 [Armillaria fumosa]